MTRPIATVDPEGNIRSCAENLSEAVTTAIATLDLLERARVAYAEAGFENLANATDAVATAQRHWIEEARSVVAFLSLAAAATRPVSSPPHVN